MYAINFPICTVGLYVSLWLMIFLSPYLHCKALRTAMYKRDINSIIIIIIIKFNKSIDRENGLICFLFTIRTIFWETSMEMDVITVNVIVKNKSTTIFHGLTLIDHRHDIKMFKTLQWNHLLVVLGSTWVLNMLTSLLWSIRVQTVC